MRDHLRHDRRVPAREPLHRREAGGLVGPVDELDDGLRGAAVLRPAGHGPFDAHVPDLFRRDLGLVEGVEHVARDDGPPVDDDGLEFEEAQVPERGHLGEVAGVPEDLALVGLQDPQEGPRGRGQAARDDERLEAPHARDVHDFVLREAGQPDDPPVPDRGRRAVVLVRQALDIERELVVPRGLRVLGQAPVVHDDALGDVEQLHRADGQGHVEARAHPAVRDDCDPRLPRLPVEGLFLPDDVRVASEVDEGGLRLEGELREPQVEEVRDRAQGDVRVPEDASNGRLPAHVGRDAPRDPVGHQAVHPRRGLPRPRQVHVREDDLVRVAEPRHVVGRRRPLPPRADDRVCASHLRRPPSCRPRLGTTVGRK